MQAVVGKKRLNSNGNVVKDFNLNLEGRKTTQLGSHTVAVLDILTFKTSHRV